MTVSELLSLYVNFLSRAPLYRLSVCARAVSGSLACHYDFPRSYCLGFSL